MQGGDGDGGRHLAISTTPPSSWLTGVAATLAAEMLHVLHQSDYWFEWSQQPAGSHNLRHSRVLHVQPSVRLSHQDCLSVCPTRSGGDKPGGGAALSSWTRKMTPGLRHTTSDVSWLLLRSGRFICFSFSSSLKLRGRVAEDTQHASHELP